MRNGKLVWTFHTVPRPGEANYETWVPEQAEDRSGANAWGNITVDSERGLVFAGVGQVTRDFDGSDRKGPNLYGSSIVALDANSGKLKWHFQTTHHDNWDYDPTSPPTLLDVVRKGRKIPAVALPTKAGLLFIWDRVTGAPIHGVEERPVVSDNTVPGDEPWPTQPFPVKPPPLTRMTFDPSEVAKVAPDHEKFCRALIEDRRRRAGRRTVRAIRSEAARHLPELDRRRQLGRWIVRSQTRPDVRQYAESGKLEQDDQEPERIQLCARASERYQPGARTPACSST